MLEQRGPQQWPMPEGATPGRARLYDDGGFRTPDGRARFVATPYRPVAEPRDARYPFALNTGRLRDQWHGMSRTGTLGRLFGHVPEPALQVHPQDLARRQLARRRPGAPDQPARLDPGSGTGQRRRRIGPGVPGHALGTGVPERLLQHRQALAGVNALTTPSFVPGLAGNPNSSMRRSRCSRPNCPGRCWRWPGCRRIAPWRRSAHCAV